MRDREALANRDIVQFEPVPNEVIDDFEINQMTTLNDDLVKFFRWAKGVSCGK